MPLTVGDRDVRPLTADEVLRMVELGILDPDEPVELLHGVLTKVSPKSPAHSAAKARLVAWLSTQAAAGSYAVRTEDPLVVPDVASLPEPDVAIVEPGEYVERHPASALLVIEVSLTSLHVDTTVKPPLYAQAGVPETWVVDVADRQLIMFAEPTEHGYARQETRQPPQAVRPSAIEVEPLDLAQLFAGL